MVLIETVGQKNKNPRIRDAKKHKKTRFRDSSKTPSRFRDWNKNFRDPEFSGYHSPPLDLWEDCPKSKKAGCLGNLEIWKPRPRILKPEMTGGFQMAKGVKTGIVLRDA